MLAPPHPLVSGVVDLDEQLQANGIDLTLRAVGTFTGGGRLGTGDDRALPETDDLDFDAAGLVRLAPGPYLARLNEVVSLPPGVMAIARPRSSLLRMGVSVHNAVWDAGYSGRSQVLIVVHNPAGIELGRDARIVQMVFMTLDAATEKPYAGSYQHEAIEQPGP
ncbi:MAG: deoxyuridine 5'-triphosphate nucleotidohydrolase [Chloroflexi bacterium]|nr:deoxyuridine 5'-triphosphate nucleotidohydrolase [Chloroflexota bacterium]